MSSPLDFLRRFAAELQQAGIRFVITSGMACVHYGLQQTTKDSDWIVPPEELERLRELFTRLEGQLPPWRVAYRPVFGAPLTADYHAHGWTSHLAVWDGAHAPEHHVDLFGRPPRVAEVAADAEAPAFASRHTVAQMKKTDRDKDWFAVDGLGLQDWLRGQPRGFLHIRSAAELQRAWRDCPADQRAALVARRPLLAKLEPGLAEEPLERMLLLERAVWQCVNRLRYGVYHREWKAFYRRWQAADEWSWPVNEPFWMQHQRIERAAREFALPPQPLAASPRLQIYQEGCRRAAALLGAAEAELATVAPPIEELLP